MLEQQHNRQGIRLQKVLAEAGVGSRRACEALIAEGRVSVNGLLVTTQGVRVDPATAVITVDGRRISVDSSKVYLALNKPRGVLTTMTDPQGRACLGDLLTEHPLGQHDHLFHVGRLDADTEGLLLLTNDGEFGNRLTHPSFEVRKTYRAQVNAPVGREVAGKLKAGILLEDGLAKADAFRVITESGSRAMVEIVLHEGRNRIVRRMLEAVGHPVQRLVRTSITTSAGGVHLGSLKPGQLRELTPREIGDLFA